LVGAGLVTGAVAVGIAARRQAKSR